jgi:hypothetical protein
MNNITEGQQPFSDNLEIISSSLSSIVVNDNESWEEFRDSDNSILDVEIVHSTNIVETVAATPDNIHKLFVNWSLYYHLPNDKNWNLSSYKPILENIDSVEQLIAVNEGLTDNIVKHCMLFVMRVGITPMWEDKKNRNGGCFSYKVVNKSVPIVWRELMYLLCGNSLTINQKHMNFINGITISPKRGFCIVKIWLADCSIQDPSIIVQIPLLSKMGCLFKSHTPEF